MGRISPQPIDLRLLSDVGQLAVSLLAATHVETPVQAMRSQLEQIPGPAVADVEGALLILARLLQDRAARRAASRAAEGETVVLSARMTREIGDVMGGRERVTRITADLEELLVAWNADDRASNHWHSATPGGGRTTACTSWCLRRLPCCRPGTLPGRTSGGRCTS